MVPVQQKHPASEQPVQGVFQLMILGQFHGNIFMSV